MFGTLIERISAGRWTELAALYAEQAVVEHPLRRSPITGRQAVHDRFAGAAAAGARLAAFDVVLHDTTDPDGLITHSRDYHDHLRRAAARGDFTGIAVPYAPVPAGPPPDVPEARRARSSSSS